MPGGSRGTTRRLTYVKWFCRSPQPSLSTSSTEEQSLTEENESSLIGWFDRFWEVWWYWIVSAIGTMTAVQGSD